MIYFFLQVFDLIPDTDQYIILIAHRQTVNAIPILFLFLFLRHPLADRQPDHFR